MLSILHGNALKWYRVKRDAIGTWLSFREEMQKFFLPNRYLSQLEQNFYNRKQNGRERAKDYILTMLTLSRQHPQLRKQNHLDRIYNGLRPEYRHYVRRNDFANLDELICFTDEFESLKREERPQTSHMIGDLPYERATRCWRCKGTGHTRKGCINPFRLFCSYCGREGILSRACDCRNHFSSTVRPTIPSDDGRYYIRVEVNGKSVPALIDTGASRTYIGESLRHHLVGLNITPTYSEGAVQMADQSFVTYVDVFPTEIIYKSNKVCLNTAVIPTLAEPIILGLDFLVSLNFELRIDGELLTRRGGSGDTERLHTLTNRDFPSERGNNELSAMLRHHSAKFSEGKGLCTIAKHESRLKHSKPIRQRDMPRNAAMIEVINAEEAFINLKETLTRAPVLGCPKFEHPFLLQTDAGLEGHEVVLFQRHSGTEAVLGSLNIVADSLPRAPLPNTEHVAKMVPENRTKTPDFQTIQNQLFKHIPRRPPPDSKPEWKMCVPRRGRTRVIMENHENPTGRMNRAIKIMIAQQTGANHRHWNQKLAHTKKKTIGNPSGASLSEVGGGCNVEIEIRRSIYYYFYLLVHNFDISYFSYILYLLLLIISIFHFIPIIIIFNILICIISISHIFLHLITFHTYYYYFNISYI